MAQFVCRFLFRLNAFVSARMAFLEYVHHHRHQYQRDLLLCHTKRLFILSFLAHFLLLCAFFFVRLVVGPKEWFSFLDPSFAASQKKCANGAPDAQFALHGNVMCFVNHNLYDGVILRWSFSLSLHFALFSISRSILINKW